MYKLTLHTTDLENYLQCPRKFELASLRRITPHTKPELRQVGPINVDYSNQSLAVGTLGHHALERYYKREITDLQSYWQEISQGIDSEPRLSVYAMFGKYEAKYGDLSGCDVVATESTYTLELPDVGVKMTGTVDLILRNKYNGKLIGLDHKFYNKPPRINADRKLQFIVYSLMLHKSGILIDEFRQNAFYKQTRMLCRKQGIVVKELDYYWTWLNEVAYQAVNSKYYPQNPQLLCNYCPYDMRCTSERMNNGIVTPKVASQYRVKEDHER